MFNLETLQRAFSLRNLFHFRSLKIKGVVFTHRECQLCYYYYYYFYF